MIGGVGLTLMEALREEFVPVSRPVSGACQKRRWVLRSEDISACDAGSC